MFQRWREMWADPVLQNAPELLWGTWGTTQNLPSLSGTSCSSILMIRCLLWSGLRPCGNERSGSPSSNRERKTAMTFCDAMGCFLHLNRWEQLWVRLNSCPNDLQRHCALHSIKMTCNRFLSRQNLWQRLWLKASLWWLVLTRDPAECWGAALTSWPVAWPWPGTS